MAPTNVGWNLGRPNTIPKPPEWGVDTKNPYMHDPNNPDEIISNPYYGLPAPAAYEASFDPLSMSLAPELQKQLGAIKMDTRGMEAFREQALRKGPSSWANLATQNESAQEANAKENAARDANAQTAQATDNLAARGGLSSGARERAAESGAKSMLSMSQDLHRQGGMNKLQIGMNDEQNRIQQLSMLPGMEYQAIQPEIQKAQMWGQARGQDISNITAENNRGNDYNKWLAEQQQKLYASNQQANATAAAGGGSWLCTEAYPDHDEKRLLLRFHRYALERDERTTNFYLFQCKHLVSKMRKQGASWSDNLMFVKQIVRLVGEGKLAQAYDVYFKRVKELIDTYWPECQHPVYREAK